MSEKKDLAVKDTKDLAKKDWFSGLLDDCRQIMKQLDDTKKHYNEARIEIWRTETKDLAEIRLQLGRRILAEHNNFERSKIYGERVIETLSEHLQLNRRIIEHSVRFARYVPSWEIYEKYIIPAFVGRYGKEPNWTDTIEIIVPAIKNFLEKYEISEIPGPDSSEDLYDMNQVLQEYSHDSKPQAQAPTLLHEKKPEKYDLVPNMEQEFRQCRKHLREVLSMITTGYIITSEHHRQIVANANNFLRGYPN